MYTFLLLLFLFVCVALTLVILLQSSKGGGLAGAFGGGGDMGAVFGGRGAASFLSKMTAGLAAAFLSLSLLLSLLNKGSADNQGLVAQEQEKRGSVPAANLPLVPTANAPGLLPVESQETPVDSGQ